ncbi:hypothetical protein ABPG74_020300 [Tetrahymena malaccensis]
MSHKNFIINKIHLKQKIKLMIKIHFFVYYCIFQSYFMSFGEDRLISFINGNEDINVNKFSCPYSQSAQFKNKFFGFPLKNDSYNFKFKTDIPHFQREVNIDFIFFRGDGCNQITVLLDEGTKNQFYMNYPFKLSEKCDDNNSQDSIQNFVYKEFEQLLKYRQKYFQNGDQVLVNVNEKFTCMINIKALAIFSIQINVNTCHQSCLTCKNSSFDSCTSCSQSANFYNGQCSCQNQEYFFQDGQCVPSCNNTQGYHQKISSQKICTYIQNCLSWDINNQKCLKCQSQMLPQLDICVNSCSSGFQAVKNNETQSNECLLIDSFKNASVMLSVFHSNDFSGIEVESINGLQIQGFMNQQNSDSIVSRCGNYQLLGGFIINKQNSEISYQFIASGFNFVKVAFKYILIDIQKDTQKADSLIQVSLNNQKTNIQITKEQISQAIDICGFSGSEVVGTFSLYDKSQTQNILTILNLNSFNLKNEDGSNKNIYLGVREVSIYSFNCLQDNCQKCIVNGTSTSCQICNSRYYLNDDGNCIKCNLTCLSCSNSSSCLECLPIEGLSLNKNNNQCVCKDSFYFDSSKTICSPCLNEKCLTCLDSDSRQCLSCILPLSLLGTGCVLDCGTGMGFNQNTNQCQKCIQNCLNCDKNLLSCNLCQDGYFFQGTCIMCQDYYGSKCISCNSSKCLKCSQGFYLYKNQCYSQCPPNTYFYKIKS